MFLKKGLGFQVTKWPKCRDSSVQSCQLGNDNPKLPNDDLVAVPVDQSQLANDALPIGAKVEIQCRLPENATEGDLSPITDSFVGLKLVRNKMNETYYETPSFCVLLKIIFIFFIKTCDFDGKITFPSDLNVTECRSRLQCGNPPSPPELSKLEIITESDTTRQEHQVQKYACASGHTLKGVQHELINSNFEVELPCVTKDTTNLDEDGNVQFLPPTEWNEPVEWPQCLEIVDSCTELPDIGATFINTTTLPINVGQSLTFKCVDPSKTLMMFAWLST